MDISRLLSRCTGLSRLFRNKTGLTMVEIMIAVLLMGVVFLGISSLYVASQRFYLTSSDKATINNETQYAIQHIYKYVMRGIGDKNTPPFQITGATQLDISINDNDPLTSANYGNIVNYRYRYDSNAKKLYFKIGSGSEEDLMPKVDVTAVNFTKTTDALTGYITASHNNQTLTFYFACYPRLASFH